MSTQSIPCDRCRCNDCAGTAEQHAGPLCQCYDCASIPEYACTEFRLDGLITLIEEQLAPLMSAHLHDRARYRCLVAAHAAFHASRDHDAATKETYDG